jgi:hypothetical protein
MDGLLFGKENEGELVENISPCNVRIRFVDSALSSIP